ncbi:MAG: hypothetical protein E2583_20995 [Comamonas sp.]|nr:hypothetical protein [Comamonas sp.]
MPPPPVLPPPPSEPPPPVPLPPSPPPPPQAARVEISSRAAVLRVICVRDGTGLLLGLDVG